MRYGNDRFDRDAVDISELPDLDVIDSDIDDLRICDKALNKVLRNMLDHIALLENKLEMWDGGKS